MGGLNEQLVPNKDRDILILYNKRSQQCFKRVSQIGDRSWGTNLQLESF